MMRNLDSIELFCGTGGLALGLQKAGFSHKALYEWDKDSCDNIISNINSGYTGILEWNVHQSDVRDIDFSSFNGSIHMISGGPPCQPFSLGGKAKAYNDKRDMFPEAVRAVREVRPQAFIFENVKGLLRQSFSEYFSYIILQLTYPSIVKPTGADWIEHKKKLEEYQNTHSEEDKEYIVRFKLLNAADFGVPQIRHRVFIVGFRRDINTEWDFPKATHSQDSLLYDKWVSHSYWERHNLPIPSIMPISQNTYNVLVKKHNNGELTLPAWNTVRDAISDLPDPQLECNACVMNHEYRPGAKVYAGHSGSSLDEPSKTIKAGSHGVPGGENMIVLDNGDSRYYTVRESARIQTFPDDYCFNASWTESMRQIGNAVPVKLAEAVGRSVADHLKECQ